MLVFELDANPGGNAAADVRLESGLDVLGLLAGHQAAGDGGAGDGRNDGARTAAGEEIDVERWAGPAPFEQGVLALACQRGYAQLAAIGRLIDLERGVECFFAG